MTISGPRSHDQLCEAPQTFLGQNAQGGIKRRILGTGEKKAFSW